MKMWIVEDTDHPMNSVIHRNRAKAISIACANRGYEQLNHLIGDGWAKKPVSFDVPVAVARAIEAHFE